MKDILPLLENVGSWMWFTVNNSALKWLLNCVLQFSSRVEGNFDEMCLASQLCIQTSAK